MLLYHRVATPEADPWSLAVSPAHFDEHMAVLRRRAAVVPLDALPALLARRDAPRRCVAVTFDDGYADNLHAALPVLERHEVPATVFVTTGAVDGPGFWWDRLERLLLGAGTLPARLEMTVLGARREWSLDGWTSWSAVERRRHRAWRSGHPAPTPRHALFMELWSLLQTSVPAVRDRVVAELERWASATPDGGDGAPLGRDDLVRLGAHPLVGVGAHTVSHPRLSALAPGEQSTEVVESRRYLEELLGRPVHSFAYPHGRPGDYTPDTVRVVREAGFTRACVNQPGTIGVNGDPFATPRAYVTDVDGGAFERHLSRWLRAPLR